MAVLTPSWTIDVIIAVLSVFITAFIYMTRNFKYWAKRGVIEEPPTPFMGNLSACTFFQKTAGRVMEDLYNKHPGRGPIGFYNYDKPCLLVRDINLANRIMVKDFNFFVDRFVSSGDHDTLGSANLFTINNPHWKILRSKISPTMTSGKLKKMFELMVAVGKDLDTHLESLNFEGEGRVVEFSEIFARFTTDIIATCAYGLRANCLNNPEAEFRKYGRRIFEFSYKRGFELGSMFFAPGLVKPLRLMFFEKSCSEFLRTVLWDTMIQRMESDVHRNDLIDTLIDLKRSQPQAEIDDPNSFKFDGDNLTAQAAIFFTGGFETTASTLSFTLYELALQRDIQSRLREEITSALVTNGGVLHYDWVTQLPYLEMVVSETLRKYPIVAFLDRMTTSDYKVPDSDLVIEKGTPVYISVSGFHHDPMYFPDPEKYDPERFNSENKRNIPSRSYIPFGDGPRNCIGLRFGRISVKLGLIKTIAFYEFTPCKETTIPVRMNPRAIFTSMKDGLFLNVRKLA